MDDLKSVFDDADGQQLLAVVASVHHHGVSYALHDGTLSLTETLGCVSAAGMREVFGIFLLHGNVILLKKDMLSQAQILFYKHQDDQNLAKKRYINLIHTSHTLIDNSATF